MVLLSLLLGIQNNVFFNSSPEIVDLRQILTTHCHLHTTNLSDNDATLTFDVSHNSVFSSLKFWIGFLMLLNICVTIMGIIATFTTWSMISAISDRNAHCLLRSSMGQYVTTLSPRLVVASVYLFLLWFLLFVVEIVSKSNPLLWVLLLSVAFVFFSIVVPLSVFGRLVLHTGAMAQRPVLSDELEKELLANGLHASLVIRAHHRQRKNTSVSNQYHRNQRHPQQGNEAEVPSNIGNDKTPSRSNNAATELQQPTFHRPMDSDETMFSSDEERGGNSEGTSLVYTEVDRNSSADAFSHHSAAFASGKVDRKFPALDKSDGGAVYGSDTRNISTAKDLRYPTRPHWRHETSDTSIDLPPATVLNMSMTGKEFNDLINNAIDTSSLGGLPGLDGEKIDLYVESKTCHPSLMSTSSTIEQRPQSPHRCRGMPPPYPVAHTSPGMERAQISPTPAHRHHRRVSSSRFLLQEWAKESNIRDLYGIAPPAEIPPEITLLAEEIPQHGHGRSTQNPQWGLDQNQPSTVSPRRFQIESTKSKMCSRSFSTGLNQQSPNRLMQPLLPSITRDKNDDNEVLEDALLGEDFVPPFSGNG
jgi:hypothetical protein